MSDSERHPLSTSNRWPVLLTKEQTQQTEITEQLRRLKSAIVWGEVLLSRLDEVTLPASDADRQGTLNRHQFPELSLSATAYQMIILTLLPQLSFVWWSYTPAAPHQLEIVDHQPSHVSDLQQTFPNKILSLVDVWRQEKVEHTTELIRQLLKSTLQAK